MPKKFEFVGSRRYDPTATANDVAMTEDNEYWGGDTRAYIRDPNAKSDDWITVGCFRELSGGDMYHDMEDVTCYGDQHKRYMARRFDSEPISISISPKSKVPLQILLNAFRFKSYVEFAVLFPDSRYLIGPARVERMGIATPIDGVMAYNLTLRRVGMPSTGEGYYIASFDLQGGKWKGGKQPETIQPWYLRGDAVKKDDIPADAVIPPTKSRGLSHWNVTKMVSGTIVDMENDKWTFEDESLKFEAVYAVDTKVMVKYIVDDLASEAIKIPSSLDKAPGETFTTHAYKKEDITHNGRKLVGWTVYAGDLDKKPTVKPYAEYDDATVSHSFSVPKDGATIFGVWKELSDVKYSDPGNVTNPRENSQNLPPNEQVVKGTEYRLPQYISHRNYQQTGWLCDVDNHVYVFGDIYEVSASHVVFTPVWKKIYHPVYKSSEDAVGNPPLDTIGYLEGKSIIMPEPGTLKKDGYTMVGWIRGGDSKLLKPTDSYTITGDETVNENHEIEFFAQWEKNTWEPEVDE